MSNPVKNNGSPADDFSLRFPSFPYVSHCFMYVSSVLLARPRDTRGDRLQKRASRRDLGEILPELSRAVDGIICNRITSNVMSFQNS